MPFLRPAAKDWPPPARQGRGLPASSSSANGGGGRRRGRGRAEPPPPHRGQRRPARARVRRSLGPGRSGRWREVRRSLPGSPPLPQPLAPARHGPFLSTLRAAWARPSPPPPSPQEAPLFPDSPSRRPGARSAGLAAPAFPRVAGAGLVRASFPWEPQPPLRFATAFPSPAVRPEGLARPPGPPWTGRVRSSPAYAGF